MNTIDFALNQTTDSAADNDIGGAIHFKMENDSDQQEIFGAIESVAKDVTDGSEDGELNLRDVEQKILLHVLDEGDWVIARRIDG